MITHGVSNPHTLQRPPDVSAGTVLDGFSTFLISEGYSCGMSKCYLSAAAHLSEWAERRGTAIADFDEDLLGSF